jgi:hypothetical protein
MSHSRILGKIVADHEARTTLVQQLAFQNANKYCREALQSRRKVSIQEMIKICSDIGAQIQGAAFASALKEVIHPSKKGGKGASFTCGQLGHFAKECHKRKRLPSGRAGMVSSFSGLGAWPPGVCPQHRGRHWAVPRLMLRSALYMNGETPSGALLGPIKQLGPSLFT